MGSSRNSLGAQLSFLNVGKIQLWKMKIRYCPTALPGEWALQKAFGPVLSEIGEDLKKIYAIGRDKILAAGYKKIRNPEDGKKANLRVTRDIFWNGAFTDEEICAEYFGGVLAASRSNDGHDDSTIQFVNVIKSLSSSQLRLHYFIYSGLNQILSQSSNNINVAQGSDIQAREIFFSQIELEHAGVNTDTDFNVLYRHGLLYKYKINVHNFGDRSFAYASSNPTTYGVLLYGVAHNRLDKWRTFSNQELGDFDGIKCPKFFAATLDDLVKQTGLLPQDR